MKVLLPAATVVGKQKANPPCRRRLSSSWVLCWVVVSRAAATTCQVPGDSASLSLILCGTYSHPYFIGKLTLERGAAAALLSVTLMSQERTRIAGRCRKDHKNGLWACPQRGEGNSGVYQTEGELGETRISGVGAVRLGTEGAGGQGPKAELPEQGRKEGALGAPGVY